MKNDYLKKRMLTGAIAITIFFTGYGLGKRNSRQVPSLSTDKCAINTDTPNNELESKFIEIGNEDGLEKSETNEDFDVNHLIVMEGSNINDASNLYILKPIGEDNLFYEEYHGLFGMCYGINPTNCNIYYYKYADSNFFQPLTNYLTEGELIRVTNRNGQISSFELDVVLTRIRKAKQNEIADEVFELIKSDNKLLGLK